MLAVVLVACGAPAPVPPRAAAPPVATASVPGSARPTSTAAPSGAPSNAADGKPPAPSAPCITDNAHSVRPIQVQGDRAIVCFGNSEPECVAIDPTSASVAAGPAPPDFSDGRLRPPEAPFVARFARGEITVCPRGQGGDGGQGTKDGQDGKDGKDANDGKDAQDAQDAQDAKDNKACSSFRPHYRPAQLRIQAPILAVDDTGTRVFSLVVESGPKRRADGSGIAYGETFDRKTGKRLKRLRLTDIVKHTAPYWWWAAYVGDNVMIYNYLSSAPGQVLMVHPLRGKAAVVFSEADGGGVQKLGRDLLVFDGSALTLVDPALQSTVVFAVPRPSSNLGSSELAVIGTLAVFVYNDPPSFIVFDGVKRQAGPPHSLACPAGG